MNQPETEDEELDYKNVKLANGVKFAMELLLKGQFEKALALYQTKKKEDPDFRPIQEQYINSLGYQYLGNDNADAALEVSN